MAAVGPANPKPSSRSWGSVDISTGATGVSDTINLTGLTLSSIQMSTAWTDAGVGFQGNVDGSTSFFDVTTTSNDPLVFNTTASKLIALNPTIFSGLQLLRLVSETTAGVAVAQAATRTIKLGLSEFVEAN